MARQDYRAAFDVRVRRVNRAGNAILTALAFPMLTELDHLWLHYFAGLVHSTLHRPGASRRPSAF